MKKTTEKKTRRSLHHLDETCSEESAGIKGVNSGGSEGGQVSGGKGGEGGGGEGGKRGEGEGGKFGENGKEIDDVNAIVVDEKIKGCAV